MASYCEHSLGSSGRWYNRGTGLFLLLPHKHPSPLSSPPNSGHTHSPTAGPAEKIDMVPLLNYAGLPPTRQWAPASPVQYILPSHLLCKQCAALIPFIMPTLCYIQGLSMLSLSPRMKGKPTQNKTPRREHMYVSAGRTQRRRRD